MLNAPSRPSGWRLELLGPVRLGHTDGRVMRVDRKSAALLAVLALEGPRSRAQLSALLWPDTPAAAARNNLVHLLRRLRVVTANDVVVVSGKEIQLAPALAVDVLEPLGRAPALLLTNLDFDDAPDLADWVDSQREQVRARQLDAGQQEVTALEAAGERRAALVAGEELLRLDPLSETLHRTVMRLHYALGDRPAALQTYARLKAALHAELKASPSSETVQLAQAIDRGDLPSAPATTGALRVLRPPSLVGRSQEWAQLEAAWAAGQGVLISGVTGSGTTRLALDFVRSKASHRLVLSEVHPADSGSPYALLGRVSRLILDTLPEVSLSEWSRAELTRRLHTSGPPLPVMSSEADKLRLYDATAELFEQAAALGPVVLAFDDLHWADEASIEAIIYGCSGVWGDPAAALKTLFVCQQEAAARMRLQPMLDAGLLRQVELSMLDEAAVKLLLDDLELPGVGALAPDLQRVTAGSPRLLVDLVKDMVETGQFSLEVAGTPSAAVSAMIARRLSQLSPGALQAARAAAVLGADGAPELVGDALHVGMLEIARSWEELEGAQVMRGERFAHPILRDVVLHQMPEPIRHLLHRSAARTLADHRAPPLHVARQWQAAQDPAQAAQWLHRAGEAAARDREDLLASTYHREAAALYTAAGRGAEAAAELAAALAIEHRS